MARKTRRDTVADLDDLTDEIDDISSRPLRYGGTSDIYQGTWFQDAGCLKACRTTKVALKVIRPVNPKDVRAQCRRLRREISVWKSLNHPNLHQLYGVYEGLSPLPALVSQWYARGDINRYLGTMRDGPDLGRIKLKLILEVAQAVEYLHGKKIVHGDIKGANVLISDEGNARLSDFGLSVLLAESSQSLTRTSNVHGTYRWMAPELVLEEGARHSYASDVWAFGCLIIEVQSGQVPYHSKANYPQVVAALAKFEPPEIPKSDSACLSTVMTGCLIFNAHERPSPSHIISHIKPSNLKGNWGFISLFVPKYFRSRNPESTSAKPVQKSAVRSAGALQFRVPT
ncbi:kinase-like protein [Exidia glandulosa HHB12029]|uniref:Kinase-like protein n=1 Tax=Exidia glandulosa HHB12029 TaxID=1314781 RepID=A0A165IDC9_EXIGL|nr:kinase-like protein [Exidia glandulosa HHB12029]